MNEMTVQEALNLVKKNPRNLAKIEAHLRTLDVCQAAVDGDERMNMYVPLNVRPNMKSAKAQTTKTLNALVADLTSLSMDDALLEMELSLS